MFKNEERCLYAQGKKILPQAEQIPGLALSQVVTYAHTGYFRESLSHLTEF